MSFKQVFFFIWIQRIGSQEVGIPLEDQFKLKSKGYFNIVMVVEEVNDKRQHFYIKQSTSWYECDTNKGRQLVKLINTEWKNIKKTIDPKVIVFERTEEPQVNRADYIQKIQFDNSLNRCDAFMRNVNFCA